MLRALVNLDPYTFADDLAVEFNGDDENDQRSADEVLLTIISGLSTRLDELRAELESIRDDEQNASDQMPESFQNGERGQKAENTISFLDDAISSLEEARTSIESASE